MQGSKGGRSALAAAIALLAFGAHAQQPAAGAQGPPQNQTLQTIVVTGTPVAQPAFDVPASVSAVRLNGEGGDQPGVNASEALRQVPGVLARDRQNYAQDEQISIRGFGARSTFGVRGVRLYTDGIPATMPDGQGQVSHFDLGSADRVEVLRGPFSALYGNSSGGVIQLFTADGSDPPQQRVSAQASRYDTFHLDADARGLIGGFGYNVDVSHFSTGGYRRHSRARRDNANAKLTFATHGGGKLTLLANSVRLPQAQDPQGLTWSQYLADPRQAAPSSLTFDTRKSVHQNQGGAVYEQPLDDRQQVRVLAYYGQRDITQFLSVPVFAEASPLSSGGVVDLGTKYGGVDARWIWNGELAGRTLQFTAGVSWDREDQHRLGYENFAGDVLGVVGALRRNEQDDVYDLDEYAQAVWQFAPLWSLIAGARHSSVHFSTKDTYITATNPDDSGRVTYGATDPVAGLLFDANPYWHLYASFGRGFETPTFNELGYRADGGAGLAFNLRPARSDNAEIGSKWRWGGGGKLDLALFQSETRNELAVFSSSGGRTTYQNIGRARRRGAEVDLDLPLADLWRLQVAYTWLDARFTQASGCDPVTGCAVAAGARIPGVPKNIFDGSLRWGGDTGWHAGLDVSAVSAVAVNDANRAHAPGHALIGADLGYIAHRGGAALSPFLRLDNLFDRRYIGSVIVNDANGRYFEPGPGRSVMVGLSVTFGGA
ncbi:MAG: TonB-dependent receptor family protein [Rhodanobacteraceae bacterium]